MTKALYRKYRPQSLSEIVGQPHITSILSSALNLGRLSHAYFFCGPKGTGKTSTARILAKSINCETKKKNEKEYTLNPCGKCDQCLGIQKGTSLDLIEIDAASNRGIDEIRELREKVHFPPSSARFKVYIIDEVHMLTAEASNALLKTLEEPPSHAVFILCTTEPHKVLKTVISRCQRFDFKRASLADLIFRLKQICEKEEIRIEEKALELIAQNATGGFRDAEGLLDKVISLSEKQKEGKEKFINFKDVQDILGISDLSEVIKFVDFLILKKSKELFLQIEYLINKGFDIHQYLKNVLSYFRDLLLIQNEVGEDLIEAPKEQYENMAEQAKKFSPSYLIECTKKFSQAQIESKNEVLSGLSLQLAIAELTNDKKTVEDEDPQKESPNKNQKQKETQEIKQNKDIKAFPKEKADVLSAKENGNNGLYKILMDRWPEILEKIKPHNHSIEAFLRGCSPLGLENDCLTLEVFYSFHKEQIESIKNRILIEKVIGEILGEQLRINCILGEKKKDEKNHERSVLDEAKEIFKGEVFD